MMETAGWLLAASIVERKLGLSCRQSCMNDEVRASNVEMQPESERRLH